MDTQQLKHMGVVGAGGAGFPTYVKAASKVEYVLANGAECEPLVHKDVELMRNFPAEIVAGMRLMMSATGAREGKFGLKKKNSAAVEAIRSSLNGAPIELVLLGDFYPSGDEYELVYSATGRLIPPFGIPLQVGCVVNNVETLYNVRQASEGIPVTGKFVSVTGAVRQPKCFRVPLGTRLRELIDAAGGASVPDYAVFISGIMMGTLSSDLEQPVTKTTAGLIVLPRDHYIVERRGRPESAMLHIGKSGCDQCSYCTEFCPRYLLGYDVRPHQVMRSLGFTKTGEQHWNGWAQLCCACGICTLYACPEDLYPKEACDKAKRDFRAAGLKFEQARPPSVHPMKEFRRVPLPMLRRRLHVRSSSRTLPSTTSRWRLRACASTCFTARAGRRSRSCRRATRCGPASRWDALRPKISGPTCTRASREPLRPSRTLTSRLRGSGLARNSIGLIELGSIASGYEACDAMLKAADVELILARSVCSGKFIVMVRGDVAAVQSAVTAGEQTAGFSKIDTFVIPNVHESVFPAISGVTKVNALDALGIIESFSVASLVEAADAAVKSANVQLVELRLAMALGGKAFATMTGSVAAVRSAVDAGAAVIARKGLLVNKVVIPSPRPELLTEMI